MKSLLSFLFALLMLTAALKAEARSLTPVEGLEALRRSFSTMQDFTADLTQEKQLSIMKKKLVMQGQIRFKKPDRFYMELVPPYSSKVLLKDTVLLQRLGNQGELQRIVLPPEQGLSRWFATLAKPITAVPEGMEVRAEQTGSQTSVTIRPAKGGQLKELSVVLHDDGTVRKLVLEERAGDKTVMTFRKTRKNVGLTDADFRLE
jgi:outer membrane lipoprotein carrier protein